MLAATCHLPAAEPGAPGSDDTAWLLDRAATYLRVHARLTEARPLQERALAIYETAHGPSHPDVATNLNNLALILLDLGGPGRGPALQERALAIDEAAYGPDHPTVAVVRGNLTRMVREADGGRDT